MTSKTTSLRAFATECRKQNDSITMRDLLAKLASRELDLRDFCRRVRVLMGADILMRVVIGLEKKKKKKKGRNLAPKGVPPRKVRRA